MNNDILYCLAVELEFKLVISIISKRKANWLDKT